MNLSVTNRDKDVEKGATSTSEDESDAFDSSASVQGSDCVVDDISEPSEENKDLESEESNKESDESEDENDTTNKGWADSVAKILKTNKPKGKKMLVLSKAKKLTDVKKEKPKDPGFQIEGEETKEEKPDSLEILNSVKEDLDEPAKKKKKNTVSIRVKPSRSDKELERSFTKIATRGVVQLFNAVRSQQKDIDQKLDEAGPLERNKEKVLKSIDKRQFLDVLMGGEQARSESVSQPVKKDASDSTWSVLRDDFMLSARFKDWDKNADDNDELQDL